MKKNNKLFENTIMLYLLTFSNYFFNLITVPYQTRILGPEIYGKIGFCIATATYFKLFFDFGFILSATEEVSKNRDDVEYVSKILSSVNLIKIFLIIFSLIPLIILLFCVDIFNKDKILFLLFFIYVAIDSFEPDFLYRGFEQMKAITIRNVFIKLFFTLMVFVFLRKTNDYILIPILNIIGSIVALLFVYKDVYKRFNVRPIMVNFDNVRYCFAKSKYFFLSRIASTIYGATNTFILGIIYPIGPTLGYYSSADKIITAGRQALSPISDSVYPHMVKNKDFKLIKKILLIFMPIIILGSILLFVFAEPFCVLAFGNEYSNSSLVLRLMIPILIITLPTYLLGFPTMSPLGISKKANLSVIIASIYHVLGLLFLYIFDLINIISICALTISTEFLVLVIRLIYIYKYRKNFEL